MCEVRRLVEDEFVTKEVLKSSKQGVTMNTTNHFSLTVLRPLLKVQNELETTSSKSRISEIRSLLIYIRNKSRNDDVSEMLDLLIFECNVKMRVLFRKL